MSTVIPKEIKEQIIARIKQGGLPAAQVAREHGVSDKTVYGWLAKETVREPGIIESNRLRREIEGLYQIIGKLTTELSKVKKGRWL